MTDAKAVLFNDFLKERPYSLMSRFAGDIRSAIIKHKVPALDVTDSEVAFSTYGVAGGDSWVHEGRYHTDRPSPMLFNWKVLLGLTAHGRPYLAELIERRLLSLAALVWSVAEQALFRYNVCTHELFSRALQAAYVDYLDPNRLQNDLTAFPLRDEELPVFMHYYGEQLNDKMFLTAVKQAFDRTYAGFVNPLELPRQETAHVSLIHMDLIRGPHGPIPERPVQGDFPTPPFGPSKPGPYLYELLYANSFRYRRGGVSVLTAPNVPIVAGKQLPSALVINFNLFLPYRTAHMGFYDKVRDQKKMSLYDMALTAADVFHHHYYGVLHGRNCGAYYQLLTEGLPDNVPPLAPFSSDEIATTFVMPLPVIKQLAAAAVKYGINSIQGVITKPCRKRAPGGKLSRRVVSAKSILTVMSPDTPYLESAEFRFVHRYHTMLISPPWSLTMGDVADYYEEERVVRVAQHLGRVYVPLDMLRRIPKTQDYMTPELSDWLSTYDRMNKYVFISELKTQSKQGMNKLVREDYGVKGVSFLPEEDDAVVRLYRPAMSEDAKVQLKQICFGRSLRSISLRAGVLRREMMSKGIYDLTQLPHGQRGESLLSEIRAAKREAAREEAKRKRAERAAAKLAEQEAERAAAECAEQEAVGEPVVG